MQTTLSTTRAIAGLQCLKRLYLETHVPRLAEWPPMFVTPADRAEVEALARSRFPGGVAIEGSGAMACEATRRRCRDTSPGVLYGAVFEHAGLSARIDVLIRAPHDQFDIVRLKLGLRLRERDVQELALALQVVEGAGLRVRAARVLVLDRAYVHQAGSPDPARLFAEMDLTPQAREKGPTIAARSAAARQHLAAPLAPMVATGPHCIRPQRCPLFTHCHVVPRRYPVTTLPRLAGEQLATFHDQGISDLREVPDTLPGLNATQRRAIGAARRGTAVREPGLAAALAEIARPLVCLDFETSGSAVPSLPGTRPFEQVPFQWSAHTLAPDGGLLHRAFLHDAPSDPREPFLESLLDATREARSLVVWSSFESDVLAALAEAFPAYRQEIERRRARIVDLLAIVREHYYHPAFGGSFSLKAVLPALVPALRYDDLAIRNGGMVSPARRLLLDPTVPAERRAVVRAQLLAYCARDTEALVRLLQVLWDGH